MKARDLQAASVLRTVLAAIDNAESHGIVADSAGALERSAVGLGAAEADRRQLTDADVAHIVAAEIADLDAAAEQYAALGSAEPAARHRDGAKLLRTLLES